MQAHVKPYDNCAVEKLWFTLFKNNVIMNHARVAILLLALYNTEIYIYIYICMINCHWQLEEDLKF